MPVCATLACWLAKPNPDKSGKIVWSHQMDQIPAAPTGLAVGTNPPSLPSKQTVGKDLEGSYEPLASAVGNERRGCGL